MIDFEEELKVNNKYRDSVFCSYFNNKVRLLSLCNAILDTNYDNPDELIINRFEGIFLSHLKNDISCKLGDNYLVLIEHQTSVNENMPLRCLAYALKLIENEIPQRDKLYREPLIKFPAPKFFVLYDGNKDEPLQREMRLSDAFDGDNSSLEFVVKSFNINKKGFSGVIDDKSSADNITATATNKTSAEKTASLIVVTYNEGVLASVEIDRKKAAAGETVNLSVEKPPVEYRTYLWDGDTLTPIN